MIPLVLNPGKVIPKGDYIVTDTLTLLPGDHVYFDPESRVLFEFSTKKPGVSFSSDNKWLARGCFFEMNYTGDLAAPNVYENGPHLMSMLGSNNIVIDGGDYDKAVEDSFYIGPKFIGYVRVPSKNIVIQNVRGEKSRRQGVSITSVIGLEIANALFKDIRGASPQAAIDVEPNHPKDFMDKVVLKNITAIDCGSHAFTVNVAKFNKLNTISVEFIDCTCIAMGSRNTVKVFGMGPEDSLRPKGFVKVSNMNMLWEVL